MRQRLNADPAKQMVHHRVADQNDALQTVAPRLPYATREKLADETANLRPDKCFQNGLTVFGHRKFDAAHHISSVLSLSIESRLNSKDPAGLQIEQLGDDGRCAQVNRHSKPGPRL